MRRRTKVLVGLFIVLLAIWAFAATLLAPRYNPVLKPPPYAASDRARTLHAKLFVADLHADSLQWPRDLLARGTWGHVDLPRLQEGNVALQVFTVFNKIPHGLNYDRNAAGYDDMVHFAFLGHWPPTTWFSPHQRALYQARHLASLCERSGGKLVCIRTQADLDRMVTARQKDPQVVGAILGMEGAYPFEDEPNALDEMDRAGFRVIGLTHFLDNDFAGSAHGVLHGGLTPAGKALVAGLEQRHMIVDLAHASPKTINDVLAVATRPVLVSHTGVRATCDNVRNLSDEQLRNIAGHGGLIGIGFWDVATCGRDAAAIARAIRHAADVAGADHVALGSDFDGAVAEPFDATGLVQITDALLAQGFTDDQVAGIMGGNALRFFRANLPQ